MQTHHCHIYGHHQTTTADKLADAKRLADKAEVRFTPLRQAVYRLILEADKPLGAYELMHQLQQEHDTIHTKKTIAPPTIYRSLEFLLGFGVIHQLTSINAFVPCCHPRQNHVAAFLICENCHDVQELSDLPVHEILNFSQHHANFAVKKSTIELQGLCHDCQA